MTTYNYDPVSFLTDVYSLLNVWEIKSIYVDGNRVIAHALKAQPLIYHSASRAGAMNVFNELKKFIFRKEKK